MMLFSSGKIGTLEVKNRLIMTAMGCSLGGEQGRVTDELIAFYETRAKGGAGLIITEVTCVNSEHGVRSTRQLYLADDSQIPMLRRLTDAVHRHGARIFPQLHHPGVMSSCQLNHDRPLVSPSGVPSRYMPQPARALTREEIHALVKDFAQGARRARDAGFDGVEIHGAHHYLIHQFLSPHFNKRQDEYGGSFENRSRFLREIVSAIREEVGPNYPLSVRISGDEFFGDEGYHLEEAVLLARDLDALGVDLINVSAGGTDNGKSHSIEPISYQEGWRSYLISAIKQNVSCAVGGTAVIRTAAYAEQLLTEGKTDFICMGRPFLADPEWPNKIAQGRDNEVRPCISCLYCIDTIKSGHPISCAVNPRCGHETEQSQAVPLDGRTAAVLGGGIAGMESACVLAERGARVTLYEKEDRLGGQVGLAANVPGKGKMGQLIHYYKQRLNRGEVNLCLGSAVAEDSVPTADILVNATGAEPIVPGFLGEIAHKGLLTPVDVLSGRKVPENSHVVIIGTGMTGLETAEYLIERNNHITMIEMADQIAPGANRGNVNDILQRLAVADTVIMLGRKLLRVTEDSVVYENLKTGRTLTLPADYVVLSLGVRNRNGIQKTFQTKGGTCYTVGDAEKSGRIRDAIRSAYQSAGTVTLKLNAFQKEGFHESE